MTDPARVREILGSYGGRNDRWPAAERDAVLAALRGDAGLRAEREAALRLDAMLGAWATRQVAGGSDAGAAAARALRPPRRWLGWAAGGGLAASVAAAFLLAGPAEPPVTAVAATAVVTPLTDENAFAGLFTTTPDEENVL